MEQSQNFERRAETDVYKNRKTAPWMRMMLALWRFLDWRVVEAQDASGTVGRCILIPMAQNNIKMGYNGPEVPIMFLRYLEKQDSGIVAKAAIYAKKSERAELAEAGLASDLRVGFLPDVGNVYRCLYDDGFKFNG